MSFSTAAQHSSTMNVKVDVAKKLLYVKHTLIYNNISNDTLKHIVLNDWNNAFSSKSSPLAKRFSDEFSRAFHLAKEEDRGNTSIKSIVDSNSNNISWERPSEKVDLVKITLNNPILPCSKDTIHLLYLVKIPNAKFTKYGFDADGSIALKNWFLNPSRYENKQFVQQSNENLDDIPNAFSDFEIDIEIPENYSIASNLSEIKTENLISKKQYILSGSNKNDVTLYLQPINKFTSYKNEIIEVSCGLDYSKITAIQKAILVDKITRFTASKLGNPSTEKILVSQIDYQRQPFYGLNQLPGFLSPFPDEFMFELKFLKTYLNNYLKENLQLNPRKEAWIYDGIQVFLMMQYIDEFYPDLTMTGNLSNFKILKSYHFINLPFNQQYNYLYMLMARKNLDQPLNEPKNRLIKFNEQIASKYRAGLSLNYLNNYLGNDIVLSSIKEFIQENKYLESNQRQFETILEKNTSEDINWFFRTIVETRELIDYKFGKVAKTKDSITINVINKTNTNAPISLFQLKNNEKQNYFNYFNNFLLEFIIWAKILLR